MTDRNTGTPTFRIGYTYYVAIADGLGVICTITPFTTRAAAKDYIRRYRQHMTTETQFFLIEKEEIA